LTGGRSISAKWLAGSPPSGARTRRAGWCRGI
jgi:hypothetical protein